MTFDSGLLMNDEERRISYFNPVNLDSLNQLAKLFATENLTVTHDTTADTAMFNVATRQLVLPAWKDMPGLLPSLYGS